VEALVNLMWPTNAGMWLGYGVVALSLLSMLGGTMASGGIVNFINAAARALSGKQQTSVSATGQALSQDDQATLDDIHAMQRLEARANQLNCDEMRAAVATIKDHFFHVHKPELAQASPPAGPTVPTNIPPPAQG